MCQLNQSKSPIRQVSTPQQYSNHPKVATCFWLQPAKHFLFGGYNISTKMCISQLLICNLDCFPTYSYYSCAVVGTLVC